MNLKGVLVAGIAALFVSQSGLAVAQSSRLDVVKSRGTLLCGVNPSFAGFSLPDSTGQWHGFDVDICRAVAAAVFGDAGKVKYVPLSAKERFTALQSGDVDVLARNATWTLSRNTQLGVNFVATNFYDGQGFMVKADSKIKSVRDLDGASMCVIAGTDTVRTLSDYFRSHGMKFSSVSFEDANNVAQAYFNGRCDAITSDRSQLASVRSTAPDPKAHIVLPEIITSEPLSPAVRAGDDGWANVVRWSFYAMVQAEALGLQSTTVRATISTSQNPDVLRFAGKMEDLGGMLGLDREWAVRIVEQVGNYGESYERNIKPIGLDRGLNRLWTDGGIIFAPTIR
jgi:general L-amino acid transport system substrate-binding protein